MRTIQLTPGSGDNFYCENCLRDLTFVRAMTRAGHEITLVPMYLPLAMDSAVSVNASPLFLGGVNVYLQQKFSLFRKTPRWLDAWFDNPALLRRIGKLSSMTTAHELGQTTLSILQGADGRQQKEIARLSDWLAGLEPKPDAIIFSNILLTGLAPALKEKLHMPMVCLLQDEADFLDALPQLFAQQAWRLVRQKAAAFDLLISVSEYYKQVMSNRLEIAPDRIAVIPIGIDTEAFTPAARLPDVPTLGYLSKMCYAHGLDILIDAVGLLRQDKGLENVHLRITGGSSSADAAFLKKIKHQIASLGLSACVEFVPEYDSESRKAFLKTLSLMAVPTRKSMAYGLFALESLACGVPFVAPDTGVFAELANNLQAGILYSPNTPAKLAETLRPLLLQPQLLRQMGQKGMAAVKAIYSIDQTVKRMTGMFSAWVP